MLADGTWVKCLLAGQRKEWLAAGLDTIAGFVDAYGMITYRAYLAFICGNTTQTAIGPDNAICLSSAVGAR